MHVSTPLPSTMTKVCIHLSLFHLEESDTELGECLGLLVKVQQWGLGEALQLLGLSASESGCRTGGGGGKALGILGVLFAPQG